MAKVTFSQIKALRNETNVGIVTVKKALDKANGDSNKAMDILRKQGAKKSETKSGNKTENGLTNIATKGNLAAIVEVDCETDTLTANSDFKALVKLITDKILANQPKTIDDTMKLSTKEGTLKDSVNHIIQITHENIKLKRFKLVKKSDDDHFGAYVHNGGQIASLVLLNGADDNTAENVAMHVAAMDPRYLSSKDISDADMAKEKKGLKKEAKSSGKPAKIIKFMVKGRMKKHLSQICLADQQFVMDDKKTVAQYVASKKGKLASFVRYQVGEE
ncbi:MAG: elongation factor Ts [Acetilactobacillus jinshanensis]